MSATLTHLLAPIAPWLDDPSVEEVCVNSPGEVWIFSRGEFTRHDADLDADDIADIAVVAAAQRRQDVSHLLPLLSTDLSGRGRLQAVVEPCVAQGYPSLTIRRGNDEWPTLRRLAESGLFKNTQHRRRTYTKTDRTLIDLYNAGRWEKFLAAAVRAKKSIVGCGVTASGKTHLAKGIIAEVPTHERLITIEDSPELVGLRNRYPNCVQLFYDKSAKAGTTASDLVQAAMRMRPSRLMLQEIRDGEAALAFLTALQTGHSGITTIHASHCAAAFDRLKVVIKQIPGGAAIDNKDLMSQLHDLVDIVVHSTREEGPFEVDEIWFRPVSLGEA